MDPQLSRREWLANAGAATVGLPLVEDQAGGAAAPRKLKVIVAGAHPDDPESTTGGTIARYTDLGHEVVCLYLTRGELGMNQEKPPKETAAIRTAQAEKACKILKARPLFAGQIDASTEVNPQRYTEFAKLLNAEKPDIVFTHWPIDIHRDHRTTSLLVYDLWLKGGKKFALFYFEVGVGKVQLFRPTHYVDITSTEERKRQACLVHASGPRIYERYHDLMNRFRGMECGRKYAEAFAHPGQGPAGTLP
jgi:N-acetylglucosamine malate deacetylase 1